VGLWAWSFARESGNDTRLAPSQQHTLPTLGYRSPERLQTNVSGGNRPNLAPNTSRIRCRASGPVSHHHIENGRRASRHPWPGPENQRWFNKCSAE